MSHPDVQFERLLSFKPNYPQGFKQPPLRDLIFDYYCRVLSKPYRGATPEAVAQSALDTARLAADATKLYTDALYAEFMAMQPRSH